MPTHSEVYQYLVALEEKANAFIDKLQLPSFIIDRKHRTYSDGFLIELYDRDGDLRGHIDFVKSPATQVIDFRKIEIFVNFDIVK